MGQTRPFFVYVNSFSECNDKYSTKFNNKSLDGAFGFRTLENRMVAADESTELSWPPQRVRVPEEKRKTANDIKIGMFILCRLVSEI